MIPLMILKLCIMLFDWYDLYNALQLWESILCFVLIASAALKKILEQIEGKEGNGSLFLFSRHTLTSAKSSNTIII